MLKNIDIQNLQPGMVIVRIIEQVGPVKIKKSGLVTSQDMVQGLIEMGVQQVEVDSDQTVEVEGQKIKKSATRKMLESNKATNCQFDEGMAEQFNRSLFLPSAQSIPSAWQFYAKRYVLAGFIALGGLGFGWTLANYHNVLTFLSSGTNETVEIASVPVSHVVQATQTAQQQANNIEPQKAKPDELTDIVKQKTTVSDEIEQNPKPSDVVPAATAIFEPELELQPEAEAEPERELTSEPEPKISADVLARFQKAMNEVGTSPVTPVTVDVTSNNNDVPRIDQLPAWVMNGLPSMAFSAHMYASIESERWVRVNGSKMVEGDKIDDSVEIVRIEAQHVILNYSGQEFSMAALTDW